MKRSPVRRIPTMRNMLANKMANRINNFSVKPTARLTEVSERQVTASVDSMVSHIWKSLASTKGADFESFSVVFGNPSLPMDLKGAGITLGNGANPNKPISSSNPPDEETTAFCINGGHFYTVRMFVPADIKKAWEGKGKGDDAEGDYYIIIPPTTATGSYNVYIIEFKTGMSHLAMHISEEEQMLKEKQVIKTWYSALGKSVNVHLFYCPYLAGDATLYRKTHVSNNVGYLSLGGLSKILGVSENTMLHFANVRSKYNQEFTKKAFKLRDRVIEKIRANPTMSLANIQKLHTQSNFGINFGPSVRYDTNYQKRRARITQLNTSRKFILGLVNKTTNAKEKHVLTSRLAGVIAKMLVENRYVNGKPTNQRILDRNSHSNMRNWLSKLGKASYKPAEETTFRILLEERRKVLPPYVFPALGPTDFLRPINQNSLQLQKIKEIMNKTNLTANNKILMEKNIKKVNYKSLNTNEKRLYDNMFPKIKELYSRRHKNNPRTVTTKKAKKPVPKSINFFNLATVPSPRSSPKRPSPSPRRTALKRRGLTPSPSNIRSAKRMRMTNAPSPVRR